MSAQEELAAFIHEPSWAQLKSDYFVDDPKVLIIGPTAAVERAQATQLIVDLLQTEGFRPERPEHHAPIRDKVAAALKYPIVLALAASVGTATEVIFLLNETNNKNHSPVPQVEVIVPAAHVDGQFSLALTTWDATLTLWEEVPDPEARLQLLVLRRLRDFMSAQVTAKRIAAERESLSGGLDDNGRRALEDAPELNSWDGQPISR